MTSATDAASTGFPAHRRSSDGRHYYRILAPDLFEEVQFIGSRKLFHRVQAGQYPERLRIAEMLAGSDHYRPIDAAEWERVAEGLDLGP